MKILIDQRSIELARYINRAIYKDSRTYYLVNGAIVVVRNGLDLYQLRGRVVDITVGWDIAVQGFCAEGDEGKKRTKVTIYRILSNTFTKKTLSWILTQKENKR